MDICYNDQYRWRDDLLFIHEAVLKKFMLKIQKVNVCVCVCGRGG